MSEITVTQVHAFILNNYKNRALLNELNESITIAWKTGNMVAKDDFKIGDKVAFKARGFNKTGIVTKINRKKIIVKENNSIISWNCAPGSLTKIVD